MASTSSTMISLPEMIDLALGSPEVGAVNFNILHNLLHVMVQQMDLRATQIEFRGGDSDRVEALLQTAPPLPSITLSEYMIPLDGKAGTSKRSSAELKDGEVRTTGSSEVAQEGTSTGTEEKKKRGSKDEGRGEKRTKGKAEGVKRKRKQKEDDADEGYQTVVLVKPYDGSAGKDDSGKNAKRPRQHKSEVLTTRDSIQKIEKSVSQLQAQLEMLPSNEVILNRARSTSQTTPVNDMWHILNLTKRMDAAEAGIGKITSIVEDLAKGGTEEGAESLEKRVWDLEHRQGVTERRMSGPQVIRPEDGAERSSQTKVVASKPAVSYEGMSLDEMLQVMRSELDELRSQLNMMTPQVQQFKNLTENVPLDTLYNGLIKLEELEQKLGTHEEQPALATAEQVHLLEETINNVLGQVHGTNVAVTNQLENFQQTVASMESELGVIQERLNTGGGPVGDNVTQDFSGLSELYNKMQMLQSDMDAVTTTSTRMIEDQDERQLNINALLEQIEVLKTVKADREDLEDALADKADQSLMNRKVSHDQFDTALEDISRGLEDAVSKLAQQETVWQQAMDDIQHDVENKLDKMEISPLKDFINAKLKTLQERVKALAAMKQDSEAAGTKMRLLRNVNCISCDTSVVMKRESDIPSVPAAEALPPNRSMRPYLTYELDLIRRQQKRLPLVRNMLHFEEAMSDGDAKKMKGKSAPDEQHTHGKRLDHLCNRYCGGSHTITTAQQRVTRVGHFLTQWGPEAVQLSEGTVRGSDGNVYKARGKLAPVVAAAPATTDSAATVDRAPSPPKLESRSPRASLTKPPSGPLLRTSSRGSPRESPRGSLTAVAARGSPRGSPRVSPRVSPTGSAARRSSGSLTAQQLVEEILHAEVDRLQGEEPEEQEQPAAEEDQPPAEVEQPAEEEQPQEEAPPAEEQPPEPQQEPPPEAQEDQPAGEEDAPTMDVIEEEQ